MRGASEAVCANVPILNNVLSTDEDEASLSDTPESSESGIGDFSQSGRSGNSAHSEDGAKTPSSDGMGGGPNTPDSAPGVLGLAKIEESGKHDNGEVNLQDLGYSSTPGSNINDGSGHNNLSHQNLGRLARSARGNRRGSTTSVPESSGGLPVVHGNAFRTRRASIAAGENQLKRCNADFPPVLPLVQGI